MIGVIGGRRLFVLFVLLILNAGLVAGLYYYLTPRKEVASRDLRNVKSQISLREDDIVNLQLEREELLAQQDTFESLKEKGFLGEQDRIVAREMIEHIRELSRVLAVRYTIKPAVVETNEEISKAGHVILSSPFRVEIDALDDIDIYRFIYLLKTGFHGHISFDRLNLVKGQEVTESVLRQIGSGSPVVLVRGVLDFTWRTILPEDQVEATGEPVSRGL